jgi:hypothetical protein
MGYLHAVPVFTAYAPYANLGRNLVMSGQVPGSDRKRVSFTVGDVSAEEMDDLADELDESRAEFIREAVAERYNRLVDDSSGDGGTVPPTDGNLRSAWFQLCEAASDQNPHKKPSLKLEKAKSVLCGPNCGKDRVLDDLIKPLKRRGYLWIDSGMSVWIVVRPRS